VTLLDPETVCARVGLSRYTVYRYMRRGLFPAPVIGRGARGARKLLGWYAHDIEAWSNALRPSPAGHRVKTKPARKSSPRLR
jgi:predicted DNA-binding transcriptional regulator AlpA